MRIVRLVGFVALVAAGACRAHPVSVVAPEGGEDVADLTPLSVAGDTTWRMSAAADVQTHAHLATPATVAAPAAARPIRAVPTTGFAAISPATVNAEPAPDTFDDPDGPTVLRAQVLLDRARFSSGVLTGRAGQNMSKALYFFQEENSLPATGRLDRATYDKLASLNESVDAIVKYTITDDDVRGPYMWIPANVYEQEKLPCECYASAIEMLDERFHTVTEVLRKLNPSVNFVKPTAGTELWVPNVEPFDLSRLGQVSVRRPITKIHIAKNGRYVHALAADGSIVFHFPTTVGSEYDPSPTGKYRVENVQWRPVFHYNPTLYSDVADSRPRATLKPGPNSPVGIVWIATSKEHVGIHGTPLPHTIGLASSHGCVRLTNWDAARLAGAVRPGVMIEFVN
jgi:lipoprotein-anchoring transpeptidase ErfK/SrfK